MKNKMAHVVLLAGIACSLMLVTGCTEKEQKGAIIGAGLGAVGGGLLGGLIGKGAGSSVAGAAIGAGVGAVGGGAIGAAVSKDSSDETCRRCEKGSCCRWKKARGCKSHHHSEDESSKES